MAWIESHIDLGDHPKVAELCFQLMIKKHEAIGHLHLLWHFTMKYAWRDGVLRRFTPRVICEAVGWEKDTDTFINALVHTGWLEEGTMKVHDWLDYSGKLVKDRLYNEIRRKTALNDVSLRKTSATLPYPTLPKDIKTKTVFQKPSVKEIEAYCKERGNSVNPQKFYDFYASKGWVVGRAPMKDWRASVRTWEKDLVVKKEGVIL